MAVHERGCLSLQGRLGSGDVSRKFLSYIEKRSLIDVKPVTFAAFATRISLAIFLEIENGFPMRQRQLDQTDRDD